MNLADAPTFERVYTEHRPAALAAALGVLRDMRAAEDVVQDVFAQLWASPASYDARRGTFRAYVTLLAWERRHGFPVPQRLPSGHRRYSERDVAVLVEAAALRDAGLPVPAAIERALERRASGPRSVFAALRRARPDLPVNVLEKHAL